MEVNLSQESLAFLTDLSARTSRDTDELLNEAVQHLADWNARYDEKVAAGLDAIERGDTIPHEEVLERVRALRSSSRPSLADVGVNQN